MALREFDGPGGHRWKAWDVTAGQIHPKTRAEDYMRDLADGWIVFERLDGEEKRRLSPYPADWQSWGDEEVAGLCARAEIVTRRLTPPLGSWKIGDAPAGPPSHLARPNQAAQPAQPAPPVPARRPAHELGGGRSGGGAGGRDGEDHQRRR